MVEPISPHGQVKVAMTIDDYFQWMTVPLPTGYNASRVMGSLTTAFEQFRVKEVYAFSSTAPVEADPTLHEQLAAWCAAGHHVGNHTHNHVSPDWVPAEAFIGDIELSEAYVGEYIERAPTKYFRYPMDMWGSEPDKIATIHAYLARAGYTPAPVSYWFYDAQFLAPYWRAVENRDEDARLWLIDTYVETALSQLRGHAAAARAMFGRDPIFIGLAHGTAMTADAIERLLAAYVEAGVVFVSMEEAMRDPVNSLPSPHVTRLFRNSTQKWAEYLEHPFENTPPSETLIEVESTSPHEGMAYEDVFGRMRNRAAAEVGGKVAGGEFDWQRAVRPAHG